MHRKQNQNVLDKAFELNAATAPFFHDIGNLFQSLVEFMEKTETLTASLDHSDHLKSTFWEIQKAFRTLRDQDFARYQQGKDKYVNIEHEIIQSLLRSNRYLDRFLPSDSMTETLTLSPEPTLYSVQSGVDIEGERVARTASVIRYLSSIGDLDAIQEKLTDLYLEHDQLIDEQTTRERFGLSLDEESLEFLRDFDDQERSLLDQLDQANQTLEALKQLVRDEAAAQTTHDTYPDDTDKEIAQDQAAAQMLNDAYTDNNDEELAQDETAAQINIGAYTDDTDEDPKLLPGSLPMPGIGSLVVATSAAVSATTSEAEHLALFDDLRTADMTFENLYVQSGDATLDSVRYINTWLLQRFRILPDFLGEFTSVFLQHRDQLQTDDLKSQFLDIWFRNSIVASPNDSRAVDDEHSVKTIRARGG